MVRNITAVSNTVVPLTEHNQQMVRLHERLKFRYGTLLLLIDYLSCGSNAQSVNL